MNKPFIDFYRCPENFASFTLAANSCTEPGYFRFGPDVICFGKCSEGYPSSSPRDGLYDASGSVSFNHSSVRLPFDLAQTINNLRLERYVPASNRHLRSRLIRHGYYLARPLLDVPLRRRLQKLYLRGWDKIPFPHWPVDTTVEQVFEKLMSLVLESQGVNAIPFIWFWPDGATSCVIMTHDVEAEAGARFCSKVMDIDAASGITSSFQIVPESRYPVTQEWLDPFRQRGFEINIHDLNHDGKLFSNQAIFFKRVESVNRYARSYGARGFRSAVMYRNPDWYDALGFSYDLSIPNVAHLDPQRGGCCTVFPYFIGKILELPLTTTQDYSLFHILNDHSIELWKRQIELIRQKHGLISFIIHPDYIIPEPARSTYLALLEHLARLRVDGQVWLALPRDVDAWWRSRASMQLVWKDGHWAIEGPGSERARVAFATRQGERLEYTISNE